MSSLGSLKEAAVLGLQRDARQTSEKLPEKAENGLRTQGGQGSLVQDGNYSITRPFVKKSRQGIRQPQGLQQYFGTYLKITLGRVSNGPRIPWRSSSEIAPGKGIRIIPMELFAI